MHKNKFYKKQNVEKLAFSLQIRDRITAMYVDQKRYHQSEKIVVKCLSQKRNNTRISLKFNSAEDNCEKIYINHIQLYFAHF